MTADQIKARFAAQGVPVSDWAKKHGFPKGAVYRVLNGYTPCKRGQMHDIAVALGLKARPKHDPLLGS